MGHRLWAAALAAALGAQLPPPARAAQGCSMVGDLCICQDAGGNEWDVSQLSFGDHDTKGPIDGCTACVGNWNYHFDICRNVQIPTAIGCTSGTTRTAYRIDEYATPSSRWCEYMGPDAQSSDGLLVSALTGNRQGLMLTYTYLSRNMRVNLICDRGASLSSVPEPVEMGGNVIEIDWRTPVTCNGAGGNTGWLIVILTSTALGVYVLGGAGYARSQNPGAGLTHPHVEGWKQLPGLCSDGVFFTRVKLSGIGFLSFLAPSGSGGYSDMDRKRRPSRHGEGKKEGKERRKDKEKGKEGKEKEGRREKKEKREKEGGKEKKKKRKEKPRPEKDKEPRP